VKMESIVVLASLVGGEKRGAVALQARIEKGTEADHVIRREHSNLSIRGRLPSGQPV
jgi:hypothetical protein